MFKDGRYLENFPRVQDKYNEMDNIDDDFVEGSQELWWLRELLVNK